MRSASVQCLSAVPLCSAFVQFLCAVPLCSTFGIALLLTFWPRPDTMTLSRAHVPETSGGGRGPRQGLRHCLVRRLCSWAPFRLVTGCLDIGPSEQQTRPQYTIHPGS